MSHFVVVVIGDDIDEQLSPFDENRVMAKYVKYTKAKLIAKGKKEIEEYQKGTYAEYLKDPKKYAENCKNESHLKYVSEEFPKKLKFTNEEIYQDQIKYYEKEDIGKKGEVYSTYNPYSKWDWYEVGGRWNGYFTLKNGAKANTATKKDIDWEGMKAESIAEAEENWDKHEQALKEGKDSPLWSLRKGDTRKKYVKRNGILAPFSYLKDFTWYEKGTMGWWGMSWDEKSPEKWDKEFMEMIESLPDDTKLTAVDCHI